MRALVAVAIVSVFSVTGCSQDEAQTAVNQARDAVSSAAGDVRLPNVDWDKYGDELKTRIDDLASQADCEDLKAELTDRGKLDARVVRYIKAKIEEAGC